MSNNYSLTSMTEEGTEGTRNFQSSESGTQRNEPTPGNEPVKSRNRQRNREPRVSRGSNNREPNNRGSNNAESTNTNSNRSSNRPPRAKGPKTSPKTSKTKSGDDVTASAKFLQISKLIKKFKPSTINYMSTTVITDKIKAKEEEDENYFKNQYKNNDRMSFLQKHIAEYIKNQPLEMIYISFVLKPSDPDFPFDLENLKLTLSVPGDYPINKRLRPSITILNQEIPLGFAVNIELGYKRIAEIAMTKSSDEEIELVDGSGLKSQFQTLDKCLELFLKQEKRQTIKFIKTVKKKSDSRESSSEPRQTGTGDIQERISKDTKISKDTQDSLDSRGSRPLKESSKISKQILEQRLQNVESMKNKFRCKVKLFKRSTQEERYKIEIPIYSNQENVPSLWKLNKCIEIMTSIPMNYPQEPISISFPNNYNTNLILKFKSDQDRKVLLDLTKEYRRIEKNLTSNVNNYKFENDNLVMMLNWICNNIEYFSMNSGEFNDWISIRSEVTV